LERGREDYVRQDLELLEYLRGIEFHAVQRNKGIDAILKEEWRGRSVLVRIQRYGEPLDNAVKYLRKAAVGKGNPLLVVIATDPLFRDNSYSSEILVVQSTILALRTALEDSEPHDTSALPLFRRFA
jgi:site-specific DNA-methyltransferase (adenine-specific)